MTGQRNSIKCKFCRVSDAKANMVEVRKDIPKSQFGWYHTECKEAYLDLRNGIDKDKEEKDKLNELMKQIYGVEMIPHTIWIRLDYLRWGKQHHNEKKKITKPISYQIIYDAFVLAQKNIDYVMRTKSFDNTGQMMLYCHAIMVNYINDAYKNQKNNERFKDKMDIQENEKIEYVEEDKLPKYKPQKRKGDISHLLK